MRSKTIRRFIGTGPIANLMLVFVALAIVGEYMHLGPIFVFTFAALSCVPLSYRLGQATEVLGSRLGPVSGGLLNATFGNAAELIISIIALNHGLFIVVRTTLVGSIVGQLLLVLGTSLLLAGLKHRNLGFNRDLVQANFTLMAIAFIAIGLPSVLMITAPETSISKISYLSPTLAAILLVIYAIAVMFSLRRQPVESDDGDTPGWRLKTAVIVLAGSTGGIIFVSEFLVTSIMPFIEETGVSQVFIGIILIPIFSNVVDHIVAITVAMKNKMDLRACECFEVPLLLTPCWWRKRRWPVSPSYFAVGERRWWERAEATFRVTSPQGLGPPRCVCLAHQRPPTQEVVGYGDKKHNGGDFGQSSYAELGYSVKTYLGIRPFGYRAPLPVDGFGLLGGHPLPPPHYLRSILIAGLVALMLRPVPREPYRRVHAHRSLLQSSDVLPCSKAAVHEVGLRVLARSLDYLLLHGCCLACIRTLRGDPYAHDDPLGTIGSQFHIVGRSKAAIGHLHHSSLGVCGGDPCRRHLGTQDSRFGAPLAVLRSLCLRQVLQRLLDPLLSLSCGALPRPLFPPCHPWVRMLSLLRQPLYLCPRLVQARLQPSLATKGSRPSAGSHPHPVLSHTLQRDRSCGHQRTYDLGQKVVQGLLVRHSNVRQHVVVDRYVAPQPTVGVVLFAQTRQPSGAPYPLPCGQQPQGKQHLGVRRRATRPILHRLDGALEGRQVQLLQKAPYSTGRVVQRHQRLQVHCSPLKLLPLWTHHPRLLGTRRSTTGPLLDGRKLKQRPFAHGFTSSRWFRTIVHQSFSPRHKCDRDLLTGSEPHGLGRVRSPGRLHGAPDHRAHRIRDGRDHRVHLRAGRADSPGRGARPYDSGAPGRGQQLARGRRAADRLRHPRRGPVGGVIHRSPAAFGDGRLRTRTRAERYNGRAAVNRVACTAG